MRPDRFAVGLARRAWCRLWRELRRREPPRTAEASAQRVSGAADQELLQAATSFGTLRARTASPAASHGVPTLAVGESPVAPVAADRSGTCLLTVCTANHLHFANALIESWRRQYPEWPAFVVVADWNGEDPLPLAFGTPLAGRTVAPGQLPFMALKYGATDLCCALKPYGLAYLIEHAPWRRIVYADSDIYFFAPLTELLARLEQASLVVVPHTLAPLPQPERFWERPTLGDLAYAGPFNAGLFGIRVTEPARQFVATWRDLVTVPGAFLGSLGGQMEQNAFNWAPCFTDAVVVLRDPAYDVAYWNLHDRSLRCSLLDDPEGEPRWTVDGRALVAFHFSGFSPARPSRLSRHDARHSLYTLPSVARLCDFYTARLAAAGEDEIAARPYAFGRFPSGIAIDDRMRRLVQEHETYLWRDLDPWTPEGEEHYCGALLSPIPQTGSLLPALFEEIYRLRADLHAVYPGARLHPQELLPWIGVAGVYEYGYEALWDRHRPATIDLDGLRFLAATRSRHPAPFARLVEPLRAERHELLRRLLAAGLEEIATVVRAGRVERYELSTIWVVRQVWERRDDLKRAFPDPLGGDAVGFAAWLRSSGEREALLAPRAAELFLAKAEGRSLARVFSYFNRNWGLMEQLPLALVGEGAEVLGAQLLALLRHGLEFDFEDVVMYLWTMDLVPWSGIPLTLELAANARRRPSPVLVEGQEALLRPVLERDPRFRQALRHYRETHATERDRRLEKCVREHVPDPARREVSVLATIDRSVRATVAARRSAPPSPPVRRRAAGLQPGVNLFGYHKSAIGLGSLSRGLAMALASSGIPTQTIPLGNVAMDADLAPEDFIRRWEPGYETNLFVSYPHLHEMLLEGCPEHVVDGRRAVVYLAWEQRDGSHYWPEIYAGFEQIWALSGFAAAALERYCRRPVHAVPSVVDFASFPPPASKEEVGLDPRLFTFLYVFDANSSIERKNPEAAIRAFAAAFSPSEPVQLVLRASNAHRLDHRERLKRLLRAAPRGLRLEVRLEPLARGELLRLLSAADCYVSLHRAEGFGYTCAEAMAYARPVIASGYSGNLEFMTPENSFLVDCVECEVAVPDGPFQRGSVWADPSSDHAAQRMREVYEQRERAVAIGRRAAADVRAKLAPEAVGERVAGLLGYPLRHYPAPAVGDREVVREPLTARCGASDLPGDQPTAQPARPPAAP